LKLRAGAVRAIVWAADYEGPVRRLVHALKFEGIDYLGRHLGAEAALRLAFCLRPAADEAAGGGPFPRPDLIVPVPLHWWRRYTRGYNQALLLAEGLSRRSGLPLARRALVRRRAGRRQMGLTRRERLRALEGCYAARRPPWSPRPGSPAELTGRTVLLVDDVMTTGATLEACARALRGAGAREVVACVLARTRSRSGSAS